MSIRTVLSALISVSALVFAGTAFAQTTVTQSTGNLLIKQGNQYIALDPAQALNIGDQLVVPPGSSVSLQLADGTIVNIAGGNAFAIPAAAAELTLVPVTATAAGAVATTGAAAAGTTGAVAGGVAAGSGFTIGAVGWTALAVAGSVAAYTVVEDDDDRPSSP